MTNTNSTLSATEKKELKAKAHGLSPVVQIGDKGLTDAVIKETDRALAAHGLIKIKVAGDDREARKEWAATLCEATQASLVQQIGKQVVIYRPVVGKKKESASGPNTPRKPKQPRATKRQLNTKD